MYIFLGIIGCLFLVILVIFLYIFWERIKLKKEISDWQIGDVIMIKEKDNQAILKGWSITFLVVQFDGKDYNQRIEMDLLSINKSAYWRRMYNDCERTMGIKPNFTQKITLWYNNEKKEKYGKGATQVHGKAIDLLTEIECQIYLKECLEREQYELAELIKKRMEQFR